MNAKKTLTLTPTASVEDKKETYENFEEVRPIKKEQFEVPIEHEIEYRTNELLGLNDTLKSLNSKFSNFAVSNRSNMFVTLINKNTCILIFKEKKKTDDKKGEDKIELKVHCMNELPKSDKKLIEKQINDSRIPFCIKKYADIFVKLGNKVPFHIYEFITGNSKDEYLRSTKDKRTYKYYLCDKIKDFPAFLHYLKQTFSKIFYQFTLQKHNSSSSVLVVPSARSLSKDEEILNEKNFVNFEAYQETISLNFEQKDFMFFFNFNKKQNDINRVLAESFGECLLVLEPSIYKKKDGENYQKMDFFLNCYPKVFADNRANGNFYFNGISKEKGKTELPHNVWLQNKIYFFPEIVYEENEEFIKQEEDEMEDEDEEEEAREIDEELENISINKTNMYLNLEVYIKGNLKHKYFVKYLSELLKQVYLDYKIEDLLAKEFYITQTNKTGFPGLNSIRLMELIKNIDRIMDMLEFYSFTIHKYSFKHSFYLDNLITLCNALFEKITDIINKRFKENSSENISFIYVIQDLNSENDIEVFFKFDYLKQKYNEIYEKKENKMQKHPKITIFCCTNIFDLFFGKDNSFEFKQIRNFESIKINQNDFEYKIPRNCFIKLSIELQHFYLSFYNVHWEIVQSIAEESKKIQNWSLERKLIFHHILLQKMGIYNYKLTPSRIKKSASRSHFINKINKIYILPQEIHKKTWYNPDEILKKKERNLIKEEGVKEDSFSVSKTVLNRVSHSFPPIGYTSNKAEFGKTFESFLNISFKFLRIIELPRSNINKENQSNDIICLYGNQFIGIAKSIYFYELQKAQRKMLMDNSFVNKEDKLKKAILSNFKKRARALYIDKKPFLFYLDYEKYGVALISEDNNNDKQKQRLRRESSWLLSKAYEQILSSIQHLGFELVFQENITPTSSHKNEDICLKLESIEYIEKFFDDPLVSKPEIFERTDSFSANAALNSNSFTSYLKKVIDRYIFIVTFSFECPYLVLQSYCMDLYSKKKRQDDNILENEWEKLKSFDFSQILYDFCLEKLFAMLLKAHLYTHFLNEKTRKSNFLTAEKVKAVIPLNIFSSLDKKSFYQIFQESLQEFGFNLYKISEIKYILLNGYCKNFDKYFPNVNPDNFLVVLDLLEFAEQLIYEKIPEVEISSKEKTNMKTQTHNIIYFVIIQNLVVPNKDKFEKGLLDFQICLRNAIYEKLTITQKIINTFVYFERVCANNVINPSDLELLLNSTEISSIFDDNLKDIFYDLNIFNREFIEFWIKKYPETKIQEKTMGAEFFKLFVPDVENKQSVFIEIDKDNVLVEIDFLSCYQEKTFEKKKFINDIVADLKQWKNDNKR